MPKEFLASALLQDVIYLMQVGLLGLATIDIIPESTSHD